MESGMLAKDVMRRKVTSVRPEMTVQELAKLLGERRITGVPVVSRAGKVVGVISQTDLVRHEREGSRHEAPVYHREHEESVRASGCHYETPDYTRVEELMTPWAISFEEDTPVEELVRQMLRKRIHRVIITRGGELCGIVTSTDMLRVLLAKLGEAKRGARAEPARARR